MTIKNYGTLMVCWNDKVSENYAWNVATAALEEEGIDKDEYGVTFNRKERSIELEDYPESGLESTTGTTTGGSTSPVTGSRPETSRRRTSTTRTTPP